MLIHYLFRLNLNTLNLTKLLSGMILLLVNFITEHIDSWFSEIIGIKCHLVKMPETTKRVVDESYAKNKIVSFADGYPFLIIGQASLDDLNSRIEIPLPMNDSAQTLYLQEGIRLKKITGKNLKSVI